MDRSFRKKIIIIFISIMCSARAHMQERFLQANELLCSGEYGKALDVYQQIEPQGYGVLFNTAYCLCKTKQYAQALVSLKRAYRLARGSEYSKLSLLSKEIEEAIGIARTQTISEQVQSVIVPYVAYIPFLIVQIMFIFLCYLLFFIFVYKRSLVRIGLLMLVMIIITFVSILLKITYDRQMVNMAIAVKKTHMYSGPNMRYYQLHSIPYGTQISVVDYVQGWYETQNANSMGWAPEDTMQMI